jgi:hypothetical protein
VLLAHSMQRRSKAKRCIGAILFLFIFSLPLHFHPSTESLQIGQECACHCGGLQQLGSAPAPAILSVAFEAFFACVDKTRTSVGGIVQSELARAPPSYLL